MNAAGGGSLADDFGAELEVWRVRMERALAARLPASTELPTRLHEAMRYAVLGGGKLGGGRQPSGERPLHALAPRLELQAEVLGGRAPAGRAHGPAVPAPAEPRSARRTALTGTLTSLSGAPSPCSTGSSGAIGPRTRGPRSVTRSASSG